MQFHTMKLPSLTTLTLTNLICVLEVWCIQLAAPPFLIKLDVKLTQ